MKLAVISDVHADISALETALEAAAEQGTEEFMCVGDVVGYGSEPQACVQLLRQRGVPTVRGNHDVWASRSFDPLRPSSVPGVDLARRELTDDARRWLRELPLVRQLHGITAVHASLHQPEAWHRVTSSEAAKACFDQLHTPICFFGHTHAPGYWDSATLTWHSAIAGTLLSLARDRRYLVNPGPIGISSPSDARARAIATKIIFDSSLREIRWV